MTFKPTKIIIHCSDSAWGDSKVINEWHLQRGFSGIGYHKVIRNGYKTGDSGYNYGYDGHVEDGRNLLKMGAHCKGHNSSSIGICLIGVDSFSEKQLSSLHFLCLALMYKYKIQKNDIYGHYEFSNKTCPNFDVEEWKERVFKSKGGGSEQVC